MIEAYPSMMTFKTKVPANFVTNVFSLWLTAVCGDEGMKMIKRMRDDDEELSA
ncbi:transmembrane protein, putative [Medicago truncatula]|uniref:Transmembrane protein, putative n=1 Tax=Medicago truncatula TaxID=3880 RepID=G7IIE8_MEDTR|nr:transmembrane protein, putative [Medicago truncatula]